MQSDVTTRRRTIWTIIRHLVIPGPSRDVRRRFDRCGRGPPGVAAANKGGVVVGNGDMWRAT